MAVVSIDQSIEKATAGAPVERRFAWVTSGNANAADGGGVQLMVLIPSQPLYGTAVRQVQELAAIDRGWDGHDAAPPRAEAVAEALAFLADIETFCRGLVPAPMVGPTPDGGVVLVWRRASSEAEILFSEPGMAEFALSDREGIRPVESRDHLDRHDLLAIARSHLIA